MPTRDARHGRLYTIPEADTPLTGKWLKFIYIEDERHIKADLPVSPGCDCPVCAHYSLGYLHHLFKLNETLYTRLATLHNLRFMTRLTERLQAEG
jgi:queuine tRNA-ribosyltransferase